MATNHILERKCDECGRVHKPNQTTSMSYSRVWRATVYDPPRSVVINIDLCVGCADRLLDTLPAQKAKLLNKIARR